MAAENRDRTTGTANYRLGHQTGRRLRPPLLDAYLSLKKKKKLEKNTEKLKPWVLLFVTCFTPIGARSVTGKVVPVLVA